MSRVINTTTMTVDGLTHVGEWFLSGGPIATLIEGDGADGVAQLKDELEGDLMLIGCGELARDLLARASWTRSASGSIRPCGRRRTPVRGQETQAAATRRDDVRLRRRSPARRADLACAQDRRSTRADLRSRENP